MEIIEEIIDKVQKNPVIQSRAEVYAKNAETKIHQYEESNNKINKLREVNTRYALLHEIYENSTIAKADPYIVNCLNSIELERHEVYQQLLSDSIISETNKYKLRALESYSDKIEQEKDNLDEYFYERYDKNHEYLKVRHWLNDFNKNGFSITGGIVCFTPSVYKGKQPIDLIDEVGEILKKNKANFRGQTTVVDLK